MVCLASRNDRVELLTWLSSLSLESADLGAAINGRRALLFELLRCHRNPFELLRAAIRSASQNGCYQQTEKKNPSTEEATYASQIVNIQDIH